MSKTHDDLQVAFAGESQANRKYLAFAKKAEAEGKPQIAHLFRVAAEAETIHALGHLNVAGGVRETTENIKSAIAGETYEIDTMYPGFVVDAETEGEARAKIGFGNALAVEKDHQRLFSEALVKVESGEDLEPRTYYICPVCGHPSIGEAPERCPVCGTPKEKFYQV